MSECTFWARRVNRAQAFGRWPSIYNQAFNSCFLGVATINKDLPLLRSKLNLNPKRLAWLGRRAYKFNITSILTLCIPQ